MEELPGASEAVGLGMQSSPMHIDADCPRLSLRWVGRRPFLYGWCLIKYGVQSKPGHRSFVYIGFFSGWLDRWLSARLPWLLSGDMPNMKGMPISNVCLHLDAAQSAWQVWCTGV